jgi:predicted Zn-dependent peptidase
MHPDFHDLTIANTILGGYFGSRLMSNIRENKGYTYGVSSHVAALRDDGFFVIGATVGADVWKDAIVECNREMTILGEESIPESELSRVKNYLIGQLQRSIDGPFQLADQYRVLWMNNLDFKYLSDFMIRVNHITAAEIRALSQKYFSPESMITVAAGPVKS